MAFISTTIYSQALSQHMNVDLFLPNDRKTGQPRRARGIIYFLTGISSNEKQFQQYTAANRYALENHMAMVYPVAPYSFYSNMKYGLKYFTYLTEELPALLESMFGISYPREKTFIAGLSMGGYGALYLGLSRPDMFGAIGSFSGACDIAAMLDYTKETNDLESRDIFVPVYGEDLTLEKEQNLFYLVKKVSELAFDEQPRIYMACGKQDDSYMIYQQNQSFKNYAQQLPLAQFKYSEWDGKHDYKFWDRAMLHAMAFFMKSRYDEKEIEHWRCD